MKKTVYLNLLYLILLIYIAYAQTIDEIDIGEVYDYQYV